MEKAKSLPFILEVEKFLVEFPLQHTEYKYLIKTGMT